ncbi:HAD superfamily, subfamily IIIB (Acid phosphatase) [Dyella sp. OK004]|uniref:5'-nucleotidase, lipoprotein e(P4) family n=1 Tax=Dyella sp. OK004 TaxID=1855292 RepID=UPI0008F3562A|nr:HAD family acid phosphatase [Dyella sp. OK004]SFR93511.1 HAD superfamily, subfamily IIIB (Acid phosphatase) [Dyella sp. OK004]
MHLRLPATLLAFTLLAACSAHTPVKPAAAAQTSATALAAPVADDNLNAVAWSQTAIEHDLIYLQTYRDAQARLLAAMKDKAWDALPKDDRVAPAKGLKPAVVLDIDETVLDNSPYQARLIKSGGEFNEADWAAWCKEQNARALPGVVEFTQFAAKHGIAVIYISNRAKDLDEATLGNLRKAGLPVSGPEAFLGLGTFVQDCEQVGTEKGCRRQLVSRKYRVLMQFGDQIGDFVTVLANNAGGRQKAMAPYMSWIGSRWFVLPNATYGSWEPAMFNNDWSAPRDERHRLKVNGLRFD